MSKNAARLTRSKKISDDKPIIKEKFAEHSEKVKVFVPTASQKQLINTIKANTITFVDSVAGTGKSSSVLWHFVREYLANHSKQIIVVRTPVEFTDDKLGFLPSDLSAKIGVHFESAKNILEDFLGKGKFASDFEQRIHFKVPNYMLGSTFTDSLILIDEAQQMSPQILKLILERTGKGCKVVVAGASDQLFEVKGKRNGLSDAITRFFKEGDGWVVPKFKDVGFHEFGISEIMREEIVKTVVTAYSNLKGY